MEEHLVGVEDLLVKDHFVVVVEDLLMLVEEALLVQELLRETISTKLFTMGY